jgi:WD40 repeat protein
MNKFLILFVIFFTLIGNGAIYGNDIPKVFIKLENANGVNAVAFSPEGRYVLSGVVSRPFSPDHNNLKLWDISTGKLIRTFKGHSYDVHSVAFSPDCKYTISSSWNKIKLWDVSTGKEMRTFKGHSDKVNSVTFSPDGRNILSGSKDIIKLWDVFTGKNVRTFTSLQVEIYSVAFSPDGKYALSGGQDYYMQGYVKLYCQDYPINLWDVSKGKKIIILTGHFGAVQSVAFSPDGKYILSGSSDKTVKLWDVSKGIAVGTGKLHSHVVRSVAYSPDGEYILSGGDDNTLRLWNVIGGALLQKRIFEGHLSSVYSVGISPDGKYALSGSQDGTTRIWNVATGKEIAQMVGFKDGEWVVITPEGYYNASNGGDKYLRIRIGNNFHSIDQYRSEFFKPQIVEVALRLGDKEKAVAEVLSGEKERPIVAAVKEPVKIIQEITQVEGPSPKEPIETPNGVPEVISEVKEEKPFVKDAKEPIKIIQEVMQVKEASLKEPVEPSKVAPGEISKVKEEKPAVIYEDVKKEIPPTSKPSKPKDTTPPQITIASPEMGKGDRVVSTTSRIAIQGKATDENGVAEVTVNGEVIELDENGNFSADVLLKVGENEVHVAAIDIYKNQATFSFRVLREGRKTVVTKMAPFLETKGKYYALIMGINDYKYIQKLETAKKDAIEVERLLRERYGFETKLIINATRMDVLNTINDFRKKLKEEDSLLIYYAGHGDYDKITDKAYWLPVDAERDNPTNWIMSDDITTNIRRIASKHILIVSDSCYSGTFVRRVVTDLSTVKSDREGFIKRMIEKTSRTLMASGGNEPVLDSGGSSHSIFAEAFLKGLKEVDENVFTADELFYGMIRERVIGKADQTPQYNNIRNSGHEGGDFVFIKK